MYNIVIIIALDILSRVNCCTGINNVFKLLLLLLAYNSCRDDFSCVGYRYRGVGQSDCFKQKILLHEGRRVNCGRIGEIIGEQNASLKL